MSKSQAMLHYQNSQHTRVMNLKYKSKYKRLKKQIKSFVFENAALCDEVSQVQAELAIAREERRYLIKRLMRHEGVERLEQQQSELDNSQQQQPRPTKATAPANTLPNIPKKRGPKKRLPGVGNERSEKARYKARDKVILDPNGKPKFPINLCNILIHSPGEIIPNNPNFHTAHWIYPVGYVATRIYAHPKDPQRKCVYTCKILNNAGMPQFQIIPDNDLDSVFFGESANVCHQGLLETLQRSLIDVVKLPLQVQGEKFFGLANPTVRMLLQMDAGYKQCVNFQGFLEQDAGSSFTLPEDKDPTMSFDALQTLITMSAYRTMPEVDELPDELLQRNFK